MRTIEITDPRLDDIPPALRLGNVMRTGTLLRCGFTEGELRSLKKSGALVSLRHGWCATPDAHHQVVRAVRSGGVLGCVSALVLRGAWQPLDRRLHVYRSRWGRSGPQGSVGWCPSPAMRVASAGAVLPVAAAFHQAVSCVGAENALAIGESLIRKGLLSEDMVKELLGRWAGKIDRSDSGTETLVRLRLRALRIRVRPQVEIPRVGRVDFLIGDRLVLEVDSKTHHFDEDAYHRDRARDQELQEQGYLVMRITWEQVMFGWPLVERRILRMIRAQLHRGDRSRIMRPRY